MTASATAANVVPAQAMDAYLSTLVQSHQFRGAITVARGSEVLLAKGYDLADVETGSPNTPRTRYRIGSVTKQFTAVAVLKAQELGKLTITDPVCRHLPSCPTAWKPITVEQLLTHTSGIPDYTSFSDFASMETLTLSPEQLVGRFRDKPLEFSPGARWEYSNSGYALLGYLIERTTGTTHADFLRRQILDPLDLKDTGYDVNDPVTPAHAVGYDDWDTAVDPIDMSVPYAAGALYSTTTDMLRWNRFILTGTPHIVDPGTRTQLLKPRVSVDATPSNTSAWYGYGWFVADRDADVTYLHSGGIPGYASYNLVKPQQQLSITILSNLESAHLRPILDTLTTMAAS